MLDIELYRAILGLPIPWTVLGVDLDVKGRQVTVQVHTGEGPTCLRITWDEAWEIKTRAVTRVTVRAGAPKCDASEVRIQTVRGEPFDKAQDRPASTGLSAGPSTGLRTGPSTGLRTGLSNHERKLLKYFTLRPAQGER